MRPDTDVSISAKAFFLPVDGSPRFCLLHRPAGAVRAAILYLHPFAEEMNRARRVVAGAARAFAAAGYAVLQLDLHGCGDSAGDFGDASWAQWQRDTAAGLAYLHETFVAPPIIWGLRSGALLAGAAATAQPAAPGLLLWQPVLAGKTHLQQFLRLALAADMLDGTAAGGGTAALMAQLEAGESVEVAGYRLAPALAQGLAGSVLTPTARMHCLEALPGGTAESASPALRRFAPEAQITVCDAAQCWITPGVDVAACAPMIQASLDVLPGLLA